LLEDLALLQEIHPQLGEDLDELGATNVAAVGGIFKREREKERKKERE
jgi:hypothetical protein